MRWERKLAACLEINDSVDTWAAELQSNHFPLPAR